MGGRTFLLVAAIGFLFALTFSYEVFVSSYVFAIVESPRELAYAYELLPSSNIGPIFPSHPTNDLPVYFANPPNACSRLNNFWVHPPPYFALLVKRGGCTFVEKAIQAEKAGAVLMIATDVDDDRWQNGHIDMLGDETERHPDIWAAFLVGASGQKWINYFEANPGKSIRITAPINHTFYDLERHRTPPAPWEILHFESD
ncbi:unnamed protein product, partial [Mesorhabditis belari]|uniref:PA domain-containing protein n=1 Tax=Mesorhabditis belari TaxID=2138241 RepID=A0AAF3F582_9BILA